MRYGARRRPNLVNACYVALYQQLCIILINTYERKNKRSLPTVRLQGTVLTSSYIYCEVGVGKPENLAPQKVVLIHA